MCSNDRETPAKLPSFRNLLIKLNSDLFEISYKKPFAYWDSPALTELEILILILEDRRFFSHHGVDLKSIAREAWRILSRQKHGGASTIDMQLVRTLTGYKSPTIRRKVYEMILSVVIQFHYSKIEILRSYLHCAYLGHGLRGLDEAADHCYQARLDQLTFPQAAELAAMLVYPCPRSQTPEWFSKVHRRALYAAKLYPVLKRRIA
ncbi:biosynthetic peptidoglycan transglycosylase [Methylocystis sp. Sn-Cys]|uniref:biosynthetic peptidoglycan transglycosylase n=1 Tax=Methylocystis sp. Sn-Cys TaxID=1701263 RepID=UPI001921D798|nr:biosynthetic peptidoglycan transglycosylase [Methylocystis sp. Sn-Cys]MBL1256180.1 transglycosylase domain-containing protein [Methylocystis sp. Sn-Cys]